MRAVPAPEPADGERDLEQRQPRCQWRLRELMAVRKNWYSTTKLVPALLKHGFEFDRSYIYRLVKADRPPNVSIELVVALCKILDCRFEDLVVEDQPQPLPDVGTGRGGIRPVLPDTPLLAADFFDAES